MFIVTFVGPSGCFAGMFDMTVMMEGSYDACEKWSGDAARFKWCCWLKREAKEFDLCSDDDMTELKSKESRGRCRDNKAVNQRYK